MIWQAGFLLLWPSICLGLELGWTASMKNWPWVAALYIEPYMEKPFCTGTIIDHFHVLTTMGCMKLKHPKHSWLDIGGDKKSLRVWVGSGFAHDKTLQNIESQYVSVKNVDMPSKADLDKTFDDPRITRNEYHSEDYTYYLLDFAILTLEKELRLNRYVQPIRFDFRSIEESVQVFRSWKKDLDEELDWLPDCYMAGWGFDDDVRPFGDKSPKRYRLVYTRMKYTPKLKCDFAYCTNCSLCSNSTEHLPNLYWCFSSYLWGDTCPGDQGAALYCDWFGRQNNQGWSVGALFGILSVRPGTCNKVSLPAKFSAIWYSYNFIERVINRGKWPPPPLGITDPDFPYIV